METSAQGPAGAPINTPLFPDKYIDEISVDPHNNYFSAVMDEARALAVTDKVLDIGCGNGAFSTILKTKTNKLCGIDGNDYALTKARERGFDEIKLITDLCSDKIPYADSEFTFIICKDVFEHLLKPDFLADEIARVLKPGGTLLLHVPNHFPLYGRIKFLFHNDLDVFGYFGDSDRWNFPHIRFYTYKSLLSLFARNDFKSILNLSGHFPCPSRPAFIIKELAKRYPDNFAEGLTLVLRKNK